MQSFQLLVQKNKGIVEELLERIKLSTEQDKKDDRPVTLQKQIKKLDAKINKLLDLRLEGGIVPEIYEEKYGALYKELEKVRSEYDLQTANWLCAVDATGAIEQAGNMLGIDQQSTVFVSQFILKFRVADSLFFVL